MSNDREPIDVVLGRLDELETAANTAEKAWATSYYATQRTHDKYDAAALKANDARLAWQAADLAYTAAQAATDEAHAEFVRATNAHTDNVNTLNRARLAVREFTEAARLRTEQ